MKKRMAQVIDGRTISVGEILGGAAQDSKGAQLKQLKDSYPPFFLLVDRYLLKVPHLYPATFIFLVELL
jgi:hypothetical protein